MAQTRPNAGALPGCGGGMRWLCFLPLLSFAGFGWSDAFERPQNYGSPLNFVGDEVPLENEEIAGLALRQLEAKNYYRAASLFAAMFDNNTIYNQYARSVHHPVAWPLAHYEYAVQRGALVRTEQGALASRALIEFLQPLLGAPHEIFAFEQGYTYALTPCGTQGGRYHGHCHYWVDEPLMPLDLAERLLDFIVPRLIAARNACRLDDGFLFSTRYDYCRALTDQYMSGRELEAMWKEDQDDGS